MRRPFQFIANDFSFSESLKSKCFDLLANLTYEEHMAPVDDYKFAREIPCIKFLVTTGYTKLQESKIRQLGIQDDFDGIFIIDPDHSDLVKRDIFIKILAENNFHTDEVAGCWRRPELGDKSCQ